MPSSTRSKQRPDLSALQLPLFQADEDRSSCAAAGAAARWRFDGPALDAFGCPFASWVGSEPASDSRAELT